jgi:nucleoside-diphosphate-sugar epimerase
MPAIVITGATGFLGRHVVQCLQDDNRIYAIDRLPRSDPDRAEHPNVRWYQIDLADAEPTREVFSEIRRRGGAQALIHLAAYYDFSGEDHPEYQRTNSDAMRRVLEESCDLGLKSFLFASSVAACELTPPGQSIDEDTPPEGEHPYARSKAKGEAMLREFADRIPSCSMRLAALYSDWCENPPLYHMLETWRSRSWNARILGGHGLSAIPYLHVRDAAAFVLRALERSGDLKPAAVLLASTDGAVSHQELFESATAHAFGAARRAIHVPRYLCKPGLWVRNLAGRVVGEQPFERPWMARLVDKRLDVDAGRTRRLLDWESHPRLGVLNRIPFMLENARSNAVEWYARNRRAVARHQLRPDYPVSRLVEKHEAAIRQAFAELLAGKEGESRLSHYRDLSSEELEWSLRITSRSLIQSIRLGEKGPFISYCRDIARRRIQQGFTPEEIAYAMKAFGRICVGVLKRDPQSAPFEGALHDLITVTVDFGVDQIFAVAESQATADVCLSA